jgi:NADH-quinone oxidoreductase subunit M
MQNKDVKILAIETSCDETAAAVVRNGREVLTNVVYSQIPIHQQYGGVVPELASRNHIPKLPEVVDEALPGGMGEIDAIAVTAGPGLLGLAVCSILFASLAAWAQRDLKRMLGYLSINHLGYCMLGLFAVTTTTTASAIETQAALSGVFLQILNHGITAATLFYFAGLLEERRGLRGLGDFGGLMQRTPLLCGWMSVAMFSSLGLPGLNGFIGEFLIFKGSFALAATFTSIAVFGLLITAIVFLRAMQALFSGPLTQGCSTFPDLRRKEKWVVIPITLLMFALGLAPQLALTFLNATVVKMTQVLF